jgi:hypothetical protein
MARKRRSGHYCWACDRMKANEKFSGRNHARHLCKDCARLGKEELDYRQAIRNMEQSVTWEGFIRRKRREQFRKYLGHYNERVRAYAHELVITDAITRAESRADDDVDELFYELADEGIFLLETDAHSTEMDGR